MDLFLSPIKFLKFLACLIVSLFILNIGGLYFIHDPSGALQGISELFNFDTEKSFPTLFSVINLFFCSMLLFLAAYNEKNANKNLYRSWLFLALIFVFLGFDEGLQIHEKMNDYFKLYVYKTDGLLHYVWIIPYSFIALITLIVSIKLLKSLPKITRNLFILSGIIFCFGALGLEIFEGIEASKNGKKTITYAILYSFEELLEMFGITLMNYALLDYLHKRIQYINIKFN